MSNTDVFDEDLNLILEIASDQDLQPLVDLIIEKTSQGLTQSQAYKLHSPKHSKYADLIAKEIRDFGGHTFANMLRGFQGPPYREIVHNVADKLKVNYNKSLSIEDIENNILAVVLHKALEKMSDEEKEKFFTDLQENQLIKIKDIPIYKIQEIFKSSNNLSYILATMLAYQLMKGILVKQSLNTIPKIIGGRVASSLLGGPIGILLTGGLLAIDIAGSAYKIITPSVIYIAALRKKYNSSLCSECENILPAMKIKFCPYCGSKIKN